MSKEQKYMSLIHSRRKDCTFTLAELTEWIGEHDNITYSASRSKAKRLIKRLPLEALSVTIYRLTLVPENVLKEPKPKSKEVMLQDYFIIAKSIINLLNAKAGTAYRGAAPDIAKIKKRLAEGFTEKEFEVVIDKKIKEWKGTEMEKFLRPETLFGTKFESYLNQKEVIKGKTGEMMGFDFNKYIKKE